MGPFAGVDVKEYQMLAKRESTLSLSQSPPAMLHKREVARCVMPTSRLLPQQPGSDGIFCPILGGPEVGTSSLELAAPIWQCAENALPAQSICPSNNVRNTYLSLLLHIIGGHMFELRARCEGQHDLVALAKS